MGRRFKRHRPGTWISVKERMPENGEEVFILERFEDEPHDIISLAFYDHRISGNIWANVTHWMEIPKLPKTPEQFVAFEKEFRKMQNKKKVKD